MALCTVFRFASHLRKPLIHSVSPKNFSSLLVRQNLQNIIKNSSKRWTTTIANDATKAADQVPRVVGWWMGGIAGMCFGAVVLGGLTRLTESGLSMVDWKLFGRPPPMSKEAWLIELDKYKESPEFQQMNSNITLEDFKFIWLMEYGHRMWGRAIGAAFYIPAAVMWAKGYFNVAMKKRVVFAGALILSQGLLGWYMVKSGLDHKNFQDPNDIPRVSQYRLAAHLSSATVLYSFLVWNALNILKPAMKTLKEKEYIPINTAVAMHKFRHLAMKIKGLVFLTLVSGAFVAGLDAGLQFNSFPKMGDDYIPEELMDLDPLWSNFFENPVTVQFDHRVLGITTLSVISYMFYKSRKLPITPAAKAASMAVFCMGWMQVALGVTTLLTYVPTHTAAMHQSGALITLTLALWLSHELRYIKFLKNIAQIPA